MTDTQDLRITFGKHKDERIQRVPFGYLTWMVQNSTHQWRDAEAELDRRGEIIPKIIISGHAIDTASLRIIWLWREIRRKNQGFHNWLCETAWEAYEGRSDKSSSQATHLDVVWIFQRDGAFPSLKTVKPLHRKRGKKRTTHAP